MRGRGSLSSEILSPSHLAAHTLESMLSVRKIRKSLKKKRKRCKLRLPPKFKLCHAKRRKLKEKWRSACGKRERSRSIGRLLKLMRVY